MVGPLTQLRLSWVVRVKNLGQAHRVKNRVGVSPGVKNWFGLTKKWDQFWIQANNLGNHPKLNPLLGLSQALRVQIRVQSGSGWPSGPEIYQIFQLSSFLVHIQWIKMTNYSESSME